MTPTQLAEAKAALYERQVRRMSPEERANNARHVMACFKIGWDEVRAERLARGLPAKACPVRTPHGIRAEPEPVAKPAPTDDDFDPFAD